MEQGKDDRAAVGRRWDNGVSETPLKPTLDEAGIDKNLAKRARILRDKSDAEFEEFIRDTRAEVKLGVPSLWHATLARRPPMRVFVPASSSQPCAVERVREQINALGTVCRQWRQSSRC
jgi:hypothetical protein